jgi:AhpD family alkylhydroperoxidase
MSTPPKKRTARLTPRPVAEWSPEMYHALAAFRSPSTETVSSPSPKRRTSPGNNALGTFACYPELAKAYLTFNGHVLYGSSLPARMRELLVLRVAVLRRCEYEWAQHVVLADTAGISPQEIDWIVEGPDRPEWGELDRSLLRAADELVAEAEVGDATWAALARHLDEHQFMDLVFTVGAYEALAMAFRSFRVEPDSDLVPNLPVTTGAWDQPSEGNA